MIKFIPLHWSRPLADGYVRYQSLLPIGRCPCIFLIHDTICRETLYRVHGLISFSFSWAYTIQTNAYRIGPFIRLWHTTADSTFGIDHSFFVSFPFLKFRTWTCPFLLIYVHHPLNSGYLSRRLLKSFFQLIAFIISASPPSFVTVYSYLTGSPPYRWITTSVILKS